jgi:hypothetical protein
MTTVLLVLAGGLAVAGLLYWRWSKRIAADIAESAGLEWARLQEADPEIVAGIDERRFRAAFSRVHFPRFPKYALAIAAGFIVVLPGALLLLSVFALLFDKIGWSADATVLAKSIPISGSTVGVSKDDGETIALYYVQDVLKFYYYFGVVFAWLAVVFIAMRRYHKRRPGYLRDELLLEKAKG